jgi:hypothetical protein
MRLLPTLAAAALLLAGALGAPAFAATITPQVRTASTPGLSVALAAATAGGDVVPNSGGVVILVHNGSGATVTVTVTSYQSNIPHGTAKTNFALPVAAGATGVIGPLDATAWNNPTGNVELAYSAATTVTVGAYKY